MSETRTSETPPHTGALHDCPGEGQNAASSAAEAQSATLVDEHLPPAEEERRRDYRDPIDVWAKWGRRYRVRASIMLAINAVLFFGLCCFAHWIRTGVSWAPSMGSYWREMARALSVANNAASLRTMLIEPISIQDVPMQIPILGLLMAALIGIPILVSILYKFWGALPFVAFVAFIALMPWLAITLVISCIIASVRPFRTSLRFMSALLGLVPAAVYLILAAGSDRELVMGGLQPIEAMKFVAPWVLAIVSAAVLFAIVLTIARMVNYRPGAVTPLLIMMFTIPVVLFEQYVGREELDYRLIELYDQYAFSDRETRDTLEEAARAEYNLHPPPRPIYEALREEVAQSFIFEITPTLQQHETALDGRRKILLDRLDSFLARYPESRYRLNVLFLRARALDMRIDWREFRRTGLRWIRCYATFPRTVEDADFDPQRDADKLSEEDWKRVAAVDRPSSLVDVATLRLAQIEARTGSVPRAKEQLAALLSDLLGRTGDQSVGTPARGTALAGDRGMFDRAAPESSLPVDPAQTLMEAQCLYDLLMHNDDPLAGYDPLCGSAFSNAPIRHGLLEFDPRSEHYESWLRKLRWSYPRSMLEDNIDLELAKAAVLELPQRISELNQIIEKWLHDRAINQLARIPYTRTRYAADLDALPEARFRLGVALTQNNQPAKAREVFERLLSGHRDSIWARQAEAFLGTGF